MYDIPSITRVRYGEDIRSFQLPYNSLLITTRKQLELLRTAVMLQADATYSIVPPDGFGNQLFTIHGHWLNGDKSYVSLSAFAIVQKLCWNTRRHIEQLS